MRNEFVECNEMSDAEERCPWAARCIRVEGGYHCYESVRDFELAVSNLLSSDLALESFRDVYIEARDIYLDSDGAAQHRPLDPAVTYDGSRWRLESAMHETEDTSFVVPLDNFDGFFYAAYSDSEYAPTFEDMRHFVSVAS